MNRVTKINFTNYQIAIQLTAHLFREFKDGQSWYFLADNPRAA